MRFPSCISLAILLLAGPAGRLLADPALPRRYLFLRPEILTSAAGLTVTVNPPAPGEVVLRPDRAWEGLMISFYLTVREEAGVLRMWYICRDLENRPNLAYAESTDGLHWRKPNLGIVAYHGSRENNLVGVPALEGVVLPDPRQAPAERYEYVTNVQREGICRYFSLDGWHWQRQAQPLLQFESDTQVVTWWDARLEKYVLYLRGWDPGTDTTRRRKVVRLTVADLQTPIPLAPSGRPTRPPGSDPRRKPWIVDELPTVLQCDAQDPPLTDIYNIAAQPYPLDPSWYVGFPSYFRHRPESDAPPYENEGRQEVHFIGSRDGIAWERYDRRAYVPPGPAGSESANMTFMGTGLIVRPDELWQYGTGFRSLHGDVAERRRRPDGVIYRYRQRLDGFVSLDAGGSEGRARTVPVAVTGGRLLLNVDTGALGDLRIGLIDAAGVTLPGFAAEDCDPVQTNSTHAIVSWHGGSDLAALAGRSVSLEIRSRRTKLYSFRFD
jgi:hypothetical protein